MHGTGDSGGGGWGSRDRNGSKYTYRQMGKGKKQGNWNTGGKITGTGTLAGGIVAAPNINLPRITPKPTGFNVPPQPVPPMPVTPITSPLTMPPSYPPVSGPPNRVDLNPATLAPWTGFGLTPNNIRYRNPFGNYPAQYNGGGPGRSFGMVKDQSRHPDMNNAGHSGMGWGGGGGGGW